jgi:hypothetical protein
MMSFVLRAYVGALAVIVLPGLLVCARGVTAESTGSVVPANAVMIEFRNRERPGTAGTG